MESNVSGLTFLRGTQQSPPRRRLPIPPRHNQHPVTGSTSTFDQNRSHNDRRLRAGVARAADDAR